MKLTVVSHPFTARVFREREGFVAHAPVFDVSTMGRTAEEAKNYLAEVILALFEHLAGSMSLRTVRVRVEKGALVALEPINLPDDMECELTLFEKPDEEGRYHGALRVLSYPPRGH